MDGFVPGESMSSSEAAEAAAAFAVMSPVIVEMSDEEFEEFMAIVEGDPRPMSVLSVCLSGLLRLAAMWSLASRLRVVAWVSAVGL